MTPANRRSQKGQRGQTLLEFAFVAPLMIIFLLALVDFGIAIDRRLVLDHAVREGARFASVGGDALNGNPADTHDVQVYTAAQSQGIADAEAGAGTNGSILVCDDGAGGVEVRITYTYDFVTGFTSFFSPDVWNIVMDPTASARIEQPLRGAVEECPA